MKKILLADDDAALRVALVRYLEKRGYAVRSVVSGLDALSAFEEDNPDLVVSDVMMPGMDGFEFCRQLRAKQEGKLVPFLFLSSRSELDDRVQGHTLGADDYLIKPFEPKELLAKIEAQLERSHRMHLEMVRLMQQASESIPDPPSETLHSHPSIPLRPLPLTPSEEKVFWEVVQGYTNRQVGDRLYISPRTVQTHLSNIMHKLKLENRAQLVRFAFEHGYCPNPSSNSPTP